jgi:hypothetical protein
VTIELTSRPLPMPAELIVMAEPSSQNVAAGQGAGASISAVATRT